MFHCIFIITLSENVNDTRDKMFTFYTLSDEIFTFKRPLLCKCLTTEIKLFLEASFALYSNKQNNNKKVIQPCSAIKNFKNIYTPAICH